MRPYKYEPIDSNSMQIRLLVIEGSKKLDAIIKCRLIRVCLETKPRYEALSYTWGGEERDSSQTQSILLDERVFTLTKNLKAALYKLRNISKPRLMWIDAICIDQLNIAERGEQVQLMRNIYQQVNGVAMWLGEAQSGSSLAFATLKELLNYNSLCDWCNMLAMQCNLSIWRESKIEDVVISVIHLFIRSYWSRARIIQEIGFANEVTVICGVDSMKWEDLKEASSRFRSDDTITLLSQHLSGHPICSILFALIDMGPQLVDRLKGEQYSSLGQLLTRYRTAMATDPRDKIYGLLGLVKNKNQSSFPIDYSLNINEVYINAAQMLAATEPDLDFLEKNDL
jgi:hypothetical protein